MNKEKYEFYNSADYAKFIEKVTSEKIFHITRYEHYLAILRDGYIMGGKNPEKNWPNYSSFFVNLGCVCVINNKKAYRAEMPKSEADLYSSNFNFSSLRFIAHYYGSTPVFLIFSDDMENELLSWKLCKEQNKLSEKVVPYYEAGYKGDIPLSKIEKAILLDLAAPEDAGLTGMLEIAREKRISKKN